MTTTASGVTIPGTNPSSTTLPSLETWFNSLGWSLNGKVVKTVASATAAAAYATAVQASPDSYTISTSSPLFVWRMDASAWKRLEYTEDGTNWYPVTGADTGWTSPTFDAAYNGGLATLQSRVIGNRVHLRRLIRPDTGTIAASASDITVCTLTAAHRPSEDIYLSATQWVNGGTPAYKGGAAIKITSAGVLSVHVDATTTGVFVDGISYTTD